MAVLQNAPGSGYAYANTRVRAMKVDLIKKEEFDRLLKMTVPEITRYLEDRAYKKQIDELSHKYSGANLVEYALTRNMAENFKKINNFSMKESGELISAYLKRWDVWNIKTVIRGKFSKLTDVETLSGIVPAGDYSEEFFTTLVKDSDSVQDVITNLKGTEYYDVLQASIAKRPDITELRDIEDDLDKHYYEEIMSVAKYGLQKFIATEIDIINIRLLMRLNAIDATPEEYHFLDNGTIATQKLINLIGMNKEEVIVKINEKLRKPRFTTEDSLADIETGLETLLMEFGSKLIHDYTLNINPIVGYFISKTIEVGNIRLIIRGKTSGLPDELIKKQLVVA